MPGVEINSLQDLLLLQGIQNQANPTYSAIKALSDGVASGIEKQQAQRDAEKKSEADFNKAITRADKAIPEEFDRKISIGPKGGITITGSPKSSSKIAASPVFKEARILGIDTRGLSEEEVSNAVTNRNRTVIQSKADATKLENIAGATADERARVAELANKIGDDFRSIPSVKDFGGIERSGANIESAFNEAVSVSKQIEEAERTGVVPRDGIKSKIAADQALIVAFNKMLDPGSVVRESEFARTPKGASAINRFTGAMKQISVGGVGLEDEDRRAIMSMAKDLVDNAREFAQRDAQPFKNQADAFGVPRNLIFGSLFEDKVAEDETLEDFIASEQRTEAPVSSGVDFSGQTTEALNKRLSELRGRQ